MYRFEVKKNKTLAVSDLPRIWNKLKDLKWKIIAV